MSKEELIQFFAEHGFLVDPDFLEEVSDNVDRYKLLEGLKQEDTLVITNELLSSTKEKAELLFVEDFAINNPKVEILESFKEKTRKIEVQDFVSYFKSRYNQLKEILQGRNELRGATSISRLKGKTNERAVLIGMINTKRITKNDHLILELEDLTGKINVLITKNREIYSHAKELVLDEVIGVSGNLGENILFADQIFFPDVPVTKELKKSTEEEYALFISDLHIGNKDFLKKEFENFLEWINGKNMDASQEQIIQKINYLFISGDIIEGVGIYPSQEKDLEIKDLYKQYEEFSKYLKKIPKRISVVICPGNHDSLRLDEPQPPITKELIKGIDQMENVFSVSNPSLVKIGRKENFEGFDVLLYHGGSFTYYADVVESIRLAGGLTRADLILKFLLQKRHLAPTHTSTSYLVTAKDHLVINTVPDFFISGHIHRCSVGMYAGITTLNASCWVPQSDYMEKRGIVPEPARAILTNLKTREVKIINFSEDASE